jgi:hypothetical protein
MSLILDKQPQEKDITRPFLAVCEGMSDATFICRLLRHAGIDNCSVGCPSDQSVGGQGVEKIPAYLAGIRTITKGREVLRGILVVADADQSVRKRFKTIAEGFKKAEFPRPRVPFKIYNNEFRVAVYLIPAKGRRGTLDHLLLEAALRNRPRVARCLDEFCSCTKKAKKWKSNERAKMRLSALVAASCRKNPWASPNTMWSYKGCPVSIGSSCFNVIREFLIQFTTQ